MSMAELQYAMQMRDLVKRLVNEELDRSRPRYRYGTVNTIDRENFKCTVTYNGENSPVQVNMGAIQPTESGQVVRIEGIGTDKFITDVIGPSWNGIRVGKIEEFYTAGAPRVIWNGDNFLSGPYNTISNYQPAGGDPVIGVPTMGAGIALTPIAWLSGGSYYPRWYDLVLRNGWTNYASGFRTAAVTKTASGIVKVSGLIKKSGTINAGELITVLPPGFRPAYRMIVSAVADPQADGSVDVWPNGNVTHRNMAPGWTSLERIIFPSADVASESIYTPITLANGFQNYSDANIGSDHPRAGWWKDQYGLVWMKGLLTRSGTLPANNTTIGTLGAATAVAKQMHKRTTSNGAFGWVYHNADGTIGYGQNSQTGYLSLDGIPHAAGDSSLVWQNMTMQNSWVVYGGGSHTSPQFTKTPDGLVLIKGLVSSGAGLSVIATLPPGYRPSSTLIFNVVANSLGGRIDIAADGSIVHVYGSGTWFSLDGIAFVAER